MPTESTIEIPLTQGQVAIIDCEDWEKVKGYNWQAVYNTKTRSFYASTGICNNGIQRTIRMHRFLLNAPRGKQVDHINHDTLDNRKSNLRLCNNSQNQRNSRLRMDNSSGYRGVKRHGSRWRADIACNNHRQLLGVFDSPEEAYNAYREVAARLHGDFAYLKDEAHCQIEYPKDKRTRSEIIWDGRKRMNNTSGFPGVMKRKNQWLAQIKFQRTNYYLGLFDTPEQASAAYQQAAALRRELGPNGSPAEFRAAVDRLRGRAQTDRDSATLLLAQHF